MRLIITAAFICLLFTSCGPAVVYEREFDLPEAGWAYADSLRFEFSIENTEQQYDYLLDVNHDAGFPSQNFYVKLHTGFPSGKRSSQQLSLQLADNFGQWFGDCNGDNCTISIPILREASFSTPGDYSLTVEQYGRDNPLTGISNIGLRVVVAE